MVFIDTHNQAHPQIVERSAVLVLERSSVDHGAASAFVDPRPSETARAPGAEVGGVPAADYRIGSQLRSLGLALLAAASILEGYRWLGIIHVADPHLSLLVFGRIGTMAFAGLALATVLAVTRPGPRGWLWSQKLMLVTSLMVAAASAFFVSASSDWVRRGLGVSDLLLAATAGAVLVALERRRRQADRSDQHSVSLPGGRAVPVS
jgi:hypothetical protein